MNFQVPDGFQLKNIEIFVQTDGERTTIQIPAMVNGVLAVNAVNESSENFTVTHLPTGLRMVADMPYERAVQTVNDFYNALPLTDPLWLANRSGAKENVARLRALRSKIVSVILEYNDQPHAVIPS